MIEKLVMVEVESSNIKAVGYSAEKQFLDVSFKSGSTHRYYGVDVDIHNSLLVARSKGSFFAKHIRGKFESQKLS